MLRRPKTHTKVALSALAALGVMAIGAGAASAVVGPVPVTPLGGPIAPPVPALPVPPVRPATRPAAVRTSGTALSGVLAIKAGVCTGGPVTSGSYFRMITPAGNQNGPYVANSDSSCGDNSFTPLSPGTDGGLSTTGYQAQPNPPFDSGGNGKAGAIMQPAKFFGVLFALSSNAKDPQTGLNTTVPSVSSSGGTLSGDLRALSVAWNNQQFNQGSPKPDGSHPGQTAGPSGTYNASSGAYTLDWTSTIVGGPFNNFTGKWHLEGTFKPAGAAAANGAAPSSGSTATPAAGSGSSGAQASSAPSGSSAGTSTGAGDSTGSMANTGPTFPAWPGAVLGALALSGLALRRRLAMAGQGDAP